MTTVYTEGYIEQTTAAEENAMGTLYNIGKPIKGKPIIDWTMVESLVKQDVMGQYYNTLGAGNQTIDKVNLNFYPLNGDFLFWMLGKRSATSGTRTITNMDGLSGGMNDTGFKPRLTLWKNVNGDKRHIYGTVFGSMNLAWGNANNGLQVSMEGIGMKHGTDSVATTPSYKGSVDSLWTTVTAMTWDSGSLTPYGLTLQLQQGLDSNVGYNGYNENINEFSTCSGVYKLICGATDGETLLADYTASNAKTFVWTVRKAADSTKLMTFTSTLARIGTVIKEEVLGLPPIYTMSIDIQNISAVVTDGL